jgi:hypothetical protein
LTLSSPNALVGGSAGAWCTASAAVSAALNARSKHTSLAGLSVMPAQRRADSSDTSAAPAAPEINTRTASHFDLCMLPLKAGIPEAELNSASTANQATGKAL